MSGTYLVHLPRAEARHLAGTGTSWPATPEARALAAIGEWLAGLTHRRSTNVPVAKVVADLTAILALAPAPTRPVRGPFAPPPTGGPPLPGHVDYLGSGTVRLDATALSALSELGEHEDFRAIWTAAGPVLLVGTDTYPARPEEPEPKPSSEPEGCH